MHTILGSFSMKNFDKQKHLEAFKRRGLSLPEWYVFSIPGQWPTPKEAISLLAASQSEGDPRGKVELKQCIEALTALVRRGWLQALTNASITELIELHREKLLPVPVYGFPKPGDVDFTPVGAEEFRLLSDELYGPDHFVEAVIESDDESQVDYFALHRHLADRFGEKANAVEVAPVQVQIEPIADWCIYWWKCFKSGFHVKVQRVKGSSASLHRQSLRDLNLKISYGPNDDRLRDFFIPAMSASIRYDRAAGYFSSTMLAVAAAGVTKLIAQRRQDAAAVRRRHVRS